MSDRVEELAQRAIAAVSAIGTWASNVAKEFEAVIADANVASELAQVMVSGKVVVDAVDEAQKIIAALRDRLKYQLVPDAFDREKITTFTLAAGYRVTTSVTLHAGIVGGMKGEAFGWLRENSLGDLITETVNSQTLSSTAKTLLDEGRELPEEFFNTHYKNSTSVTKVKGKG